MLLVVNSLPKAGSTYFSELIFKCCDEAGYPRAVKLLPEHVNAWGNPGQDKIQEMVDIARDTTTAIKTHAPPIPEFLRGLEEGVIKMIYIVRLY